MAKIHTVEWTPAILAHPTLQIAMQRQLVGPGDGAACRRLVGRISSSEIISGIPGSPTDHHGVPYSMTEEFVAVYRMHPLLPDELSFRSVATTLGAADDLPPRSHLRARGRRLQRISFTDAMYSFGTMHPGAITLHNYPKALQRLTDLDGILNDVARDRHPADRERGVPRYNEFRELLHKPRLQRFEELSGNPQWHERTAPRLR